MGHVMKRRTKEGLKLVCFAIVLGFVIGRVYKVVAWKDTSGNYLSATSQLYSTEENLMDVVFMGSSHCYCGVYPACLWRDAGIAAFNMAISGQDKDSTYHALLEVLKTQSPKVVCIDLYGVLFDRHGVVANEYRNMLSMKYSANSIKLVREYVEQDRQSDFIARWPIIHTRYKELDKFDFKQYEPSVYGRGAYFSWYSYPEEIWHGSGHHVQSRSELSEESREWIKKLYELSLEEDFSLVFFAAPFVVTEESQGVLNSAGDMAAEYGIDFMDFNQLDGEIGLDYGKDFFDADHCNAEGAEKITGYLREYLSANYMLEDHRGDPDYELWDLDLKWYEHSKAIHDLKRIKDKNIEMYLSRIISYEDIVTVISMEGDYSENLDYYASCLSYFGIDKEDCGRGGKWLFKDGYTVKILENDTASGTYLLDLGDTDTLRVQFVGDLNEQNIMINGESYLNPYCHLTLVSYDAFTGELIESRGF